MKMRSSKRASVSDKWFVEVKGQVYGPKASAQIIRDLLDGHLKVIYRISQDTKNWRAICNEVYFDKKIREEIEILTEEAMKFSPDQQVKFEATKGESAENFEDLNNVNKSISEQLVHATRLQEINVKVNGLRALLAEISAKKKLVIDVTPKAPEEIHPDDESEFILEKRDWTKKEREIIFKRSAVIAGLFLLFLVGAKYFDYQKEQAELLAKTQLEEADRQKKLGNYDKAIAAYQAANAHSSLDPHTLIEMAEAQIQSKKYEVGGQIIQSAIKEAKAPVDRAKAHSLLGVISLQKNEIAAAKVSFEQSIKEVPLYPALFNLSVGYLNQGAPEAAEELLLKAIPISDGHDLGPALLGLFDAALQIDQKPRAPEATFNSMVKPVKFERLSKVREVFHEYEKNAVQFSAELLVAKIIMAHLTEDKDLFGSLSEDFLKRRPDMDSAKKIDISLNYQRSSWKQIYIWCLDLYKADQRSDLGNAVFARCLQRSHGAKEALPYAQFAYIANPTSPAIKETLAELFLLSGEVEKAKDLLATTAPAKATTPADARKPAALKK